MNKRLLWWMFASLIVPGVLFWCFPLFHVVPLHEAAKQQQNAAFDAAAFASNFWKTKLLPAADRATSTPDLWKALASDQAAARKKFGHSPGMSSVAYFLVQGSGTIASVHKDAVQLTGVGTHPQIL